MTWFKVDDSFHSHPKVLAAAPAALGLWVVAGSWCGANLSDGFVPDHVLPRLIPDGASLAQQLVSAGLWRRARGGYQFHDWADFNPKRSDVEAERRAARERMRNLRSSRKTAGQPAGGSGEHIRTGGRSGNEAQRRAGQISGRAVSTYENGPTSGHRSAGQRADGSGEQPANVRAKFVTPTRPDPNSIRSSGSGVPSGPDPSNPDWRSLPAYGQAEPQRETPARAAARDAATRARRTRPSGRDAFTELRLITDEETA